MRSKEPLLVEVGQLLRSEIGAQQHTDISAQTWKIEDLAADSLKLSGAISKIDHEMLRLDAVLTAEVAQTCDRCLKHFSLPVEVRLDEIFSRAPETEQWPILAENILDLREPLRQQMLLSLPTHPLCFADCLGLCSYCGQELRVCHHSPNRDTLSPQVKVSRKNF